MLGLGLGLVRVRVRVMVRVIVRASLGFDWAVVLHSLERTSCQRQLVMLRLAELHTEYLARHHHEGWGYINDCV